MTWTAEQQAAIGERGSLIVSAAAGAGKTAVLTERIAGRIQAGTPVNRFLVLTFTRAAAAEMKRRIERRLADMAEGEGDDARRRYLMGERRKVNSAQISTIHSFCVRVLKRHAHVLGRSRDTRVSDDMEVAVLIQQVKDALLTELAGAESPDWRLLLSAFGSEDAAWEAVFSAYTFLLSQPDPEGWMAAAAARYGDEESREELLAEVVADCKGEMRLLIAALTAARDGVSPDMPEVIGVLDDDLNRFRALLLQKTYEDYRLALSDLTFSTLRFPKGTEDGEKAPIRGPREACKKRIKEQRALLTRPMEEETALLAQTGRIVSALFRVTAAFRARFRDAKDAKNVMDFSDLEHLTLAALSHPEVAAEYREKFDCIAVDEYQDTSRVQEAILAAVARPDNLFYVGDVKQSIYRFRQAEPALFLEKLAAFGDGKKGKRIDLNKNFRSGSAILAAVNDTFAAVMSEEAGEMAYEARSMLYPGADGEPGGAELHLIERAGAETDDALEAAGDAEVEALLIAGRCRELMAGPPYHDGAKGPDRPLTYSDFAVLVRSTTHAQLIAETLSRCGIPCYAQSNGGYFDSIEVQVLLNLLRVIDNGRMDVPLLSVMRSSIGDFSAEELAEMRMLHREGGFYQAVAAAAKLDTPLGKKTAAFLAMLARYRRESRLVSVEQLIGQLLDETGFYEEAGAGENGRQRQSNLNALLDKARIFESGGARGVWSFLQHIQLARAGGSFGAADTAAADVVRILSVHKSKGLEFPVVFLCQNGARFNTRGASGALLLDGDSGVGIKFLEESTRVRRDTAFRGMLGRKEKRRQLAEEMRVLYVAMTRAKHRLILTACVKNAAEKAEAYCPAPDPMTVLNCSSPVDWLLMGRRSALELFVYPRDAFLSPAGERETARPPLPPPDAAVVSALEARFGWRYPFAAAVSLPSKAAVSRLSGGETVLPAFDEPAFLETETRHAAFFGTAMHAVLEHLPLLPPLPVEQAEAFIRSLGESRRITPQQAERASAGCLRWFVETALYERMCRSSRVERELPFGYEMAAAALFDTDADEGVLLQGVIDCAFLEDGAWVLLDYKTDRVPEGSSPAETGAKHFPQLAYYRTALAALTGRPVKEAHVVLLTAREIVSMPEA